MHDIDAAHEHFDMAALGPDAIVEDVEGLEMFTLTSVGIDIGSATSHLVFSRLTLRREGAAWSGRFTVTNREILYRSQIMLTPYLAGTLIDIEAEDLGQRGVTSLMPDEAYINRDYECSRAMGKREKTPGNGRHEYSSVTFPARSAIPLFTHTLDTLPRVQHPRCVKEDRGVIYGRCSAQSQDLRIIAPGSAK